MSEAAVSVQGLRKGFGGEPVLSDVSFEVAHGQTCALLGRNGVGKTTAIRIVDVAGGKHWLSTIAEFGFVESALDLALASGQTLSYGSFHSKPPF